IVVSNPAACSLLGIPPQFANEKYPLAKWHTDLFEILKFGDLKANSRVVCRNIRQVAANCYQFAHRLKLK
ncbi:hypothetical protein, partial [Acinetobacter baumannii]|uniref:hypothetical protein n=1 Tax=Acinetobacter baumannii TaxID=470 RepID=UPI00165EE2F4